MRRLVMMSVLGVMLVGCTSVRPRPDASNGLVLTPVAGPLATQTPVPTFPLTLHSGMGNGGSLSATLRGGEIYSGQLIRLGLIDAQSRAHAADWDLIYGSGFFAGTVLTNEEFLRATLTGARGTSLVVELCEAGAGKDARWKGVARDEQGNVFKLSF